jgi:hypothetical protein
LLVLGLTLLPAAAFAQASIAGVVKDSSGTTTTRGKRRWRGAHRAGWRAFAPPRRLSVNRGFG